MLTLNKNVLIVIMVFIFSITVSLAQFTDPSGLYNTNNYYAGYNTNYYNGGFNQFNTGYNTYYGNGYSPYAPYSPNQYSGYNTFGYGGSTNFFQQSTPGGFNTFSSTSLNNFWPQFNTNNLAQCNGATTDFIVAIPPGACTPNVVRSDLLAEQNVPVFCRLAALKINPLIDVSAIQSIAFAGSHPPGIAGVSYHPPRQAVRSYNTIVGSPFIDDAGYVVITLSRQADERDLQRFIEGNLTARIRYDARNLYGTGEAEYYLEADDGLVPFWNGKGFLEVTDVSQGFANIDLYTRRDTAAYRRFTLQEGQTSELIFFPGYYCSAGVRIRLNSVVSPEDMALLNVEGDKIWVRRGSRFLNNRCTVNSVNVFSGGSGTLDLSCAGKRITLELNGKGTLIYNGLDTREYSFGSEIVTASGQRYYLAYAGEDHDKFNFIVLTTNPVDKLDTAFLSNHFSKRFSGYTREDFAQSIENDPEGKSRIGVYNQDYFLLYSGGTIGDLQYSQVVNEFVDNDVYGVNYEMSTLESVTRELVELYTTEQKFEGSYWGEEALFQQIILAGQTGHSRTQNELIELFEAKYPGSDFLQAVIDLKKNNNLFDYKNAHTSVQINNEFFNIFVESFRAEKDLDKSATIKISGRSSEFVRENDRIEFEDGALIVEVIDVAGITFRFDPDSLEEVSQGAFIPRDGFGLLGGREIEVQDINSREVAYVSVQPQTSKIFSEAEFSYKIGIEKRDIELNPDRTKRAIDGLNETIAEWEDMLERLGKVISVWKATCFATSSILMLQTMVSGFDGESLARQKVMRNYKTVCDIEIGKGVYHSRTECYNALSGQIDSEVNKVSSAINSVNSQLKQAQNGNVGSSGLLGKGQITNQTKYVEDLKRNMNWEGIEINGIRVETNDLTKSTEVSKVLLYQQLGCNVNSEICRNDVANNVACCSVFEEMAAGLQSAAIQKKANEEGRRVSENIKNLVGGSTPPTIQTVNSPQVRTLNWNGQYGKDFTNIPSEITEDERVQFLNFNGVTYLLTLKVSTLGDSMGVGSAYTLNNQNQWERVENLNSNGLDGYVFVGGSAESCKNNVIKNPEVRFYESGRNQGLPAIVPFDVQNGWYVYVPNSQGVILSGTQQSYTAAGDVNFFWICNVGKNGIMEQKSGDDLCQSFSANQIGFNTFISCGIQGREVGELYSRARDSIRQAAVGYGNRGFIDILGQNVRTGQPVSSIGGSECQDFMSPSDCKMLFNACDPVICPASRCDLGGKYPVTDVVQTGIIGSIALCMPNAREGIIFPVCLTGIHAGMDAFVSILRSEQQCLQHNLDNGEYVGICDEITAIYTCEFFWRNFGSLLDVILPSFFENLFGQPTVRGGGEYLNVQSAWDNLGKSMEFFTGFYAENAISSFQLRNSQNIGTEVCNGFLGTSLPLGLGAEGIDALLAPQSPTQFYAYFSEIPFTDATSPATSHYKVYYHIYAGNDFGASYQVYLRNPPASGFYASAPVANVQTGFVPRGESADEAIDFTGPAGYKELCVRINNQEHCGFGTVSSSFAANYAAEKYAEDQATQTDITSEAECVSTTGSAYGLVSPNLQAGIETAAGGRDINLVGITRVCASSNPSIGIAQTQNTVICTSNNDCGSGYSCERVEGSEVGNCVDRSGIRQQSQGRWVDVGYCTDPNIRCWLDTSTLQDRFNAIDAVNQEIYGQPGTVVDHLKYGQLFDELTQTYEQALAILSEQYNRISALTPEQLRSGDRGGEISSIIQRLDEIIGVYSAGIGTANNKAQALALKASIYRMIIEQRLKDNANFVAKGTFPPSTTIVVDNSVSTSTEIVNQPTGNTQPNAFFNTRNTNGNLYIYYGDVPSPYYIKSNIIFKEQELTDRNVGRIDNERVIINQDRGIYIGAQTLGDLDGLFYSPTKGFYS